MTQKRQAHPRSEPRRDQDAMPLQPQTCLRKLLSHGLLMPPCFDYLAQDLPLSPNAVSFTRSFQWNEHYTPPHAVL